MSTLVKVAGIAVVIAQVLACARDPNVLLSGSELSHANAPDGLSRAFVWVPDAPSFLGATNSKQYQVWIQYLQGDRPLRLLLRAEHTDGFKITWKDSRDLEVCYGPSQISYFQNFFEYGEEHQRQLYEVEVSLKREPNLASCG